MAICIAAPALNAQSDGRSDSPSLVVFISVDQLRPEYMEAWRHQFTGGFKRLLDDGRFFRHGFQDHGFTETAPGHASMLSGRFPYSTGITRNSIGVNTPTAPLIGAAGTGASPFRFQGTTLIDWISAAEPRARALSVSRKDRGAILPVGRGKHSVFWYAPSEGNFVTSSWYADTLPSWVQDFNAARHVMNSYAGRSWELLLPEAEYPEPDSVEVESGGSNFTFPHLMPGDTLRANNMIQTFPWMDDLTIALALAGVNEMNLGGRGHVDMLAVSLSTTDAVGHRWGPDSRELHDQVLRLDRSLGVFLDSLIALRGEDRIILALTADHGVAPYPEVRSRWNDNQGATRVSRDSFNPAINAIAPLIQQSGIDPDAFSDGGSMLVVDRSKTVGKDRELREISRRFAAEASKVPGVMRADVIDDLANADTVSDHIARRWLHMFRPGGEVLVTITLDPYNYWGGGGSATHGSPHDYDARVPIFFWGSRFASGISDANARVVDIAPTLAEYLGMKPLERLDGRVIPEAWSGTPF